MPFLFSATQLNEVKLWRINGRAETWSRVFASTVVIINSAIGIVAIGIVAIGIFACVVIVIPAAVSKAGSSTSVTATWFTAVHRWPRLLLLLS